ncbi:MAG: HAD family hydrolase [Clostridia bacterium]
MIQLAIFDLDGTLVNTIGDLAYALNHALETCGLPTLTQTEVEAIVGYSTIYMFQHAVAEEHKDDWQAVGEAYNAYYPKHCCDHARPYDGILHVLNRLKAAGIKLAVVSNKPHRDTLTVVETLFPKDLFSMVLGRMEKFATKPDPEPLHFVLDYFGCKPEDAVYIGDSEVDVRFAKNANMPCISVLWGYRTQAVLVEAGATKMVDEVDDICKLLLDT